MDTPQGTSRSAMPGIGISVFIGAAGAIMRYAVTQATPGFNLHTGGVILMFVGLAGVLLSLLIWSSLSPLGRRESITRSETTSVDDGEERVSRSRSRRSAR